MARVDLFRQTDQVLPPVTRRLRFKLFLKRVLRCVKKLATDKRLPRWLRAMICFGLIPLPWFFDEMALALSSVILIAFYRRLLQEAWETSHEA